MTTSKIERQLPKAKKIERDPQAPKTENQLAIVTRKRRRTSAHATKMENMLGSAAHGNQTVIESSIKQTHMHRRLGSQARTIKTRDRP